MVAAGKVTAEDAWRLATAVDAAKPDSSRQGREAPEDARPTVDGAAEELPTVDDGDHLNAAAAATARVGICGGTVCMAVQ